MAYTMSLPIRTARACGPRIQPSLIAPCTFAPYSTASRAASTSQLTVPRRQQSLFQGLQTRPKTYHAITLTSSARNASTVASDAVAPSTRAPSRRDTPETLTWNRFLALRRIRRRVSLVASIVSSVIFTGAGIVVVSSLDLEAMGAQVLGLDPLIMMGLSTMAFTGVGWLVGPFFGNMGFKLWYRAWAKEIAAKEREFYARIKRYRVDPTSSSMNNPVPDYYGEKIGSVADYRRWLKDQRAFNLKTGASRRLINKRR